MLQIKAYLIALWQTAVKISTPHIQKAVGLMKRHRIASTVICGLVTLSMLMSVITVSIHKVTVLDNGEQIANYYSIFTDEESILERNDLLLGEGDEVALTEEGGEVTLSIARAFPIYVYADGKKEVVLLAKGTVADALAKAGITCGAEDLVDQPLDQALESGMEIRVDRVRTETVEVTEEIEYDTKNIRTDELYVGNSREIQKGKNGEKKMTYEVTYVNGEEAERKLISEEVIEEPVERIVEIGSKIKSSFKTTSSTPKNYVKRMAMECTAYSAGGSTATGIPAQWGVIAVDPRVIPLGTRVYVESADGKYIYGEAIAADTGGAIKGNIIDICVNSRAEAYRFGRRTVNVYILE